MKNYHKRCLTAKHKCGLFMIRFTFIFIVVSLLLSSASPLVLHALDASETTGVQSEDITENSNEGYYEENESYREINQDDLSEDDVIQPSVSPEGDGSFGSVETSTPIGTIIPEASVETEVEQTPDVSIAPEYSEDVDLPVTTIPVEESISPEVTNSVIPEEVVETVTPSTVVDEITSQINQLEATEDVQDGSKTIILDLNDGKLELDSATLWQATTNSDGNTYKMHINEDVETVSLPIPISNNNYIFGGWKKTDGTIIVYGNGIERCNLDISDIDNNEYTLAAVWYKYSIDITNAYYKVPFNSNNSGSAYEFTNFNENGLAPSLELDVIPFLNQYANELTLNYSISYTDANTNRRITTSRSNVVLQIDWNLPENSGNKWDDSYWGNGKNPTSNADFRALNAKLQTYFKNDEKTQNTWARLNDSYLKNLIAQYERNLSSESGIIDSKMEGDQISLSNWGTYNTEKGWYSGGDSDLTSVKMNLGYAAGFNGKISGNTNYLIDTVNPANVTFNLFDYWLFSPFYTDANSFKSDSYYNPVYSTGVNNGRALIFRNYAVEGGWNNWTGDKGGPNLDIVINKLDTEGYPFLNVENSYKATGIWNDFDGGSYNMSENLSYLFDPNEVNCIYSDDSEPCKVSYPYGKAYTNVKGLLKINENGNYYFSSGENFAEYDHVSNSFNVYDTYGVVRGGNNSRGQFFPFNSAEQVFEIKNDKLSPKNNVSSTTEFINHYLGLTMEAEFMQPVGGMVSVGVEAKPMVFEFSGDDDVWIFIDNVLVADIGGIHDEQTVKIDFSTGQVLSYLTDDPNEQVTSTTIKAMFEEAGSSTAGFTGSTFASNTIHTLKLFYLERGNVDSNLTISFNLMEPESNKIIKLDQNGNPIAGVTFALHPAEYDGNQVVVNEDIDIMEELDSSARITNLDGELILPQEYDFSQYDYYVLREKETPNGYFSSQDIILRYDRYKKHPDGTTSGTNLLLVENKWTTGSTANFSAQVYQSGTLKYDNQDYGIIDDSTGQAGLILAIPVMKDTTGSWLPLYGSTLTGFNSVKYWSDGKDEAENQRKAILEAALYQIYATQYSDSSGINYQFREWCLEWNNANMRYEGTLIDFPGEANRYYWASHSDDADLAAAYYFLDLTALTKYFGDLSNKSTNEKYEAIANYIEEAAQNSTSEAVLIDVVKTLVTNIENSITSSQAPAFALLDVSDFNRVFASRIYVVNTQPQLVVNKIDQDSKPLPGVEFSLCYVDEHCVDDTCKVASGRTNTNGILVFSHSDLNSTDENKNDLGFAGVDLKPGKYWLVETSPDGYIGFTNKIPVYVTSDGRVYADALDENDGVTVQKGLGKLYQTMVRYAGAGDVNATLRDIVAQLFVVDTFEEIDNAINNPETPIIGNPLYLHYGLNNKIMEYGTHKISGVTPNPYFEVDTGIAGIIVEQNYTAHEGESLYSTVALKTHLEDTNIRGLFTGLTTIVIRNRKEDSEGTFSITKTVSGSNANTEQEFQFSVSISETTSQEGMSQEKDYKYSIFNNSTDDKTVSESGTIKFKFTCIDDTSSCSWMIDSVATENAAFNSVRRVNDTSPYYIYLQHGETFKVEGIPFDLVVTAEEIDNQGYTTTYSINGGQWLEYDVNSPPSGIVEKPIGNPNFVFNNHLDSVSNLTVTKLVDDDAKFPFTIKLYDPSGATLLTGSYDWEIVNINDSSVMVDESVNANKGTIEDGVLEVSLGNQEKVVIKNLPVGTQYIIKETTLGYSAAVRLDGKDVTVVNGAISGIILSSVNEENQEFSTNNVVYTNTRSGSISITKRTGTNTLLSGAGFTIYTVDSNGNKTMLGLEQKTQLAMRHTLVTDAEGFDKEAMRYTVGTESYIVHRVENKEEYFYYRFLTDDEVKKYYAGTLDESENVEAVVIFDELDLSLIYAIEETTVPEGYMQNSSIKDTMSNITFVINDGNGNADYIYDYLYTVTNHLKMELPVTGLRGINFWLGAGTGLLVTAATLLHIRNNDIRRRKRRARRSR